jgi:general secretion pathway protein A
MFMEHFKLGMQPFGVTPDPKFLYLSQTHREALASLFYGIEACRGFAALIAPPGLGKTTLLTHLLGLMPGAKTAFLFQTLCGPEEFLRSLLADLGIENDGDLACLHAKLNAYLLRESREGHKVVVIIDEAQNLDDRALELLRMLSNFETPSKKLMHLVLSGQPQLAQRLASEHLAQLRQRISIIAKLSPLKADETREYIDHRLQVAGAASKQPIFSKAAYELIAEHSGGIPRNINNLCFNSMSLACALKRSQVEASMVGEVLDDLDLGSLAVREHSPQASQPADASLVDTDPLPAPRRRVPLAVGLLIFAVCIAGLVWAWAGLRVSRVSGLHVDSYRNKTDGAVQPASAGAVLNAAPESKQAGQSSRTAVASASLAGQKVGKPASESETQAKLNDRPHHASIRPHAKSSLVAAQFNELPLPVVSLEHMQAPFDKKAVPFELVTQREKQ